MITIRVLSSSGVFLKLRGILNALYWPSLYNLVVVAMSYYSSKYIIAVYTKQKTRHMCNVVYVLYYYYSRRVYKTLARICALRALYSFRTIILLLLVCVHISFRQYSRLRALTKR